MENGILIDKKYAIICYCKECEMKQILICRWQAQELEWVELEKRSSSCEAGCFRKKMTDFAEN